MEKQDDFCPRLYSGAFCPRRLRGVDRDFRPFLNQIQFRTTVGPAETRRGQVRGCQICVGKDRSGGICLSSSWSAVTASCRDYSDGSRSWRKLFALPREHVGRNNQGSFRRFGVPAGDFADAFAGVGVSRIRPYLVKGLERVRNVACCDTVATCVTSRHWVNIGPDYPIRELSNYPSRMP